jgi:hypothetical protein
MSRKILTAMVAVPALWVVYGLLLALFSPLRTDQIVFIMCLFPLVSVFGVRATEVCVSVFGVT